MLGRSLDNKLARSLTIILMHLLSAARGQFVYLNTGVIKFIAGIGLPINVETSSGSLSWFNNMQVFYKLPDNITYYEPYKVMHKRSVQNTLNRFTLYQAFDKYLDRLGFTGNQCVYRLICETAKRKLNREENGLLGEILDILFTPDDGEPGLKEHKKAKRHGTHKGSDCGSVFKDCSVHENSMLLVSTALGRSCHVIRSKYSPGEKAQGFLSRQEKHRAEPSSVLTSSSVVVHKKPPLTEQHKLARLGKE